MEKIKQFLEGEKGKDFLIVIIVILVGLGSFELGRLSKEDGSGGIKIMPAPAGEDGSRQGANAVFSLAEPISGTSGTLPNSGKTFFASSKGTKYYTISCSAGKTIKQENRVWFMTGEEAEMAGYELSSSCR